MADFFVHKINFIVHKKMLVLRVKLFSCDVIKYIKNGFYCKQIKGIVLKSLCKEITRKCTENIDFFYFNPCGYLFFVVILTQYKTRGTSNCVICREFKLNKYIV